MSGRPIEVAIAAIAKEFAATGKMLDVERAAFGLETAYPETALTTDEIRVRIVEAMSAVEPGSVEVIKLREPVA